MTPSITSKDGVLSFLLSHPIDLNPLQLTTYCGLLRDAKRAVDTGRPGWRPLITRTERLRKSLGSSSERSAQRVGKALHAANGKPKKPKRGVSGHGLCLCGCGVETSHKTMRSGVVKHRRFLAGHDRRLEATVRAVIAGTLPCSILGINTKRFLPGWYVLNAGDLALLDLEKCRPWRDYFGTAHYSWEEWYDASTPTN